MELNSLDFNVDELICKYDKYIEKVSNLYGNKVVKIIPPYNIDCCYNNNSIKCVKKASNFYKRKFYCFIHIQQEYIIEEQ